MLISRTIQKTGELIKMTIPFTTKTDIALDCLQTWVETYHEFTIDQSEKDRKGPTTTAMEIQNRINQNMLELIEAILADSYARAVH